jgi:hypothetical protein
MDLRNEDRHCVGRFYRSRGRQEGAKTGIASMDLRSEDRHCVGRFYRSRGRQGGAKTGIASVDFIAVAAAKVTTKAAADFELFAGGRGAKTGITSIQGERRRGAKTGSEDRHCVDPGAKTGERRGERRRGAKTGIASIDLRNEDRHCVGRFYRSRGKGWLAIGRIDLASKLASRRGINPIRSVENP